MNTEILKQVIENNQARQTWIDNLIEERLNSTFDLNEPPSELTLALILVNALAPELVDESIRRIEEKYFEGVGEVRNILETLIVFSEKSGIKDLSTMALPWIASNNWHKLSCMFGGSSEIRGKAIAFVLPAISLLTNKVTELKRIYPLFALAYCQGKHIFEAALKCCPADVNKDLKLVADNVINDLKTSMNLKSQAQFSSKTLANNECPVVLKNQKLKIALCVSGQLRGFRTAAESLCNLGLERHEVQTFVHTWRKVGGRFPHRDQADRIFPKKFANAYKLCVTGRDEQEMIRRYPTLASKVLHGSEVTEEEISKIYKASKVILEDDTEPPFNTLPSLIKMHWKMEQCFRLANSISLDYDLIIRIRPDLKIPLKLDCDWIEIRDKSSALDTIYADFGTYISPKVREMHFGEVMPLMVGDLFAVGTPKLMSTYMRSLSLTLAMFNEPITGLPKRFMAHTTISRVLMYHGVYAETFPDLQLTGKDLVENALLSPSELLNSIASDVANRSTDSVDKELYNAALEDMRDAMSANHG